MGECIVYQPASDAPAAILMPCKCGMSVKEIAEKDVPAGVPYWIVSTSDIDALYSKYGDVRCAWRVSEASIGRVPDGVGAP